VSGDQPAGSAGSAGSALSLVDVRRLWPDIVEATKQRRRLTWIYLTQQARVVGVDDESLTLGFANAGARDSFDSGGSAEIVRQAAIDVVGHDWQVETIVDPGAEPEPAAASQRPAAPAAETAGRQPDRPSPPEPPTDAPDWARGGPSGAAQPAAAPATAAVPDADGGAHPDDTDAESSGLDGAELLAEALEAQVIEQIPHQ
jgi:DNA polymerase-3 subunit gamma/tau